MADAASKTRAPARRRAARRGEMMPVGEVWIDLVDPTPDDAAAAHRACNQRIPSRADLSEVESSSRHYLENGAIYLSAPLMKAGEAEHPALTPVGFIVTATQLVTVRYEPLKAFDAVGASFQAQPPLSGYEAFVRVLEAVIDREADILEQTGEELETVGRDIFTDTNGNRRPTPELRRMLRQLGHCGERLGKLRHSLATLARLIPYVAENAVRIDRPLLDRLASAKEDVASLVAFQEALTNKAQFLLDAALGFINIDQNDVIKVLTVVSVVGVPPTLVASIYGMNFKIMPELNWTLGYPYALGLIVLSTLLPLAWFKAKRWF